MANDSREPANANRRALMKSELEKVVWTVSQDGSTVSGAYGGKAAKAKAKKESGGKSDKMTYGQFRQKYPHLEVVFFDA